MLPFATKPLDEWTAADLQSLLDQRIEEGQRIEYKREPYGASDSDRKELLKDVSSMANAYGGHLFIGIEEADGRATALLGIDDVETHATGLLSSCLASIEPHIIGLRTRLVPLAGGRHVVVVAIPRSHRAPHMVTFQRVNQFWVRHDRRKDKMSVDEIREGFLRAHSLIEDTRTFLNLRWTDILESIVTTPLYVLGLTPLTPQEDIVDIFDEDVRKILRAPKDMRPAGWNFRGDRYGTLQPTLDGLRRQLGYGEELEVFRNGHLEARISIEGNVGEIEKREDGTERRLLKPFPLTEYLVSFCRFASEMHAYLGLQEPCLLTVWLFNLFHYGLPNGRPGTFLYGEDVNLWNRRHLILPGLQVSDLSNPAVARERADRLWQAFGWERCPVFRGDRLDVS